MKRAWLAAAAAWAALCGACAPSAKTPGTGVDLPERFAAAFREEAVGDPRRAADDYLNVVAAAAPAARDPWQVAALEASTGELVTRAMPSLGDASADASLAARVADDAIAPHLEQAEAEAAGPFAAGVVARALQVLAERRGDPAGAAKWRTAAGCAREAVVVGPLTWTTVTGVDESGPFDAAGAPLEDSYATGGAFGTVAHPVVVTARGCALDLSAESARPGVREVVVDVDVPRAQTIGVSLRAHGAATLRVGGLLVLRRPFELGDGDAARFAAVSVPAGTVRVSARVGTAKPDDSVEIDFWSERGGPLPSHAPRVGSTAPGAGLGAQAVSYPVAHRPEDELLASVAALSAGDPRTAEYALGPDAARGSAPPALALAYSRAVESTLDLSQPIRAERARSAYAHVLEAWPGSWEAAIAHAVWGGARRGRDERPLEVLREIDETRARSPAGPATPMLDAFDALESGRERLLDRAAAALDRARGALAGTRLFADAESAAVPLEGHDLARRACDPTRAGARDTTACFQALRAAGESKGAQAELDRLRALLGAPTDFSSQGLQLALAVGDDGLARRAYDALLPAKRSLGARSLLESNPGVLAWMREAATTAPDAPAALGPLLRWSGDDPARAFDGVAAQLADQDRRSPVLPAAATAVLEHIERYDVSPSGLVRWSLFDVRRVSGTTDVEENAQAAPPDTFGRAATRPLRRRIFKRDGRVLEPEPTPRASQAHADLSQLEQGDVVEAIYEGWLLPSETGDIGIDTPDLLPERTAVHHATIELRLPATLRGALWSHPLLGRPVERTDGGARVLTWTVEDAPARRFEDGVPRMDRSADVSFSTTTWARVARALGETMAALDEHDPEVAAWARDAAGPAGGGSPRATVDAVVEAAGRALRESDPGTLSDYGGGVMRSQSRTARTFLASRTGSRSWLIVRALRELGVPCDVVVAEDEPFSADPAFPPHFGRFAHPLVVAHAGGQSIWIDADVRGLPLPAGHISPELRGRLALYPDGRVAPLPDVGGGRDDERDEVDVRLTVDGRGDARGTFAVVLRGREAQELSETFLRVVGAERQRVLRDVVLAWLPWANVDDVQLASAESSWQVSLRADVSVSGYAQAESKKTWLLPGLDALHTSWPRAHVSSLVAAVATRAGRESALAVNRAVQYHVHRRIELPPSMTAARLPGPVAVRSGLVDASRSINVGGGGRVVDDDFVLGVATGTIAPADYGAFVKVAHAVDDGFLAPTRVREP